MITLDSMLDFVRRKNCSSESNIFRLVKCWSLFKAELSDVSIVSLSHSILTLSSDATRISTIEWIV